MKRWYNHSSGRPPKPTWQDLTTIREESKALYKAEHPVGEPIPIVSPQLPTPDGEPSAAEIADAVRRLKRGRSPGASGVRAGDLQEWLRQSEAGEDEVPWQTVVEVVQDALSSGEMPEELFDCILVLVPKTEPGQYRGVGLVESL